MDNIKFYKLSYEYLINKLYDRNYTDINAVNELLDGVYSVDTFFDRLLSSAQNYQGMPNYIGYWKHNRDLIRKTVFYPDIQRASNKFQTVDKIYEAFIAAGIDMKNSQKSWLKYSNTVFKGIKYLSRFNSQLEFQEDVKRYAEINGYDYKKYVTDKLSNVFGFALGCDFLKEQGFLEYSKPDVHIKAVISLKLILEYNFPYKSLSLSDHDYFDAITEIARDNKKSPYHIDKLIWLCCTGNIHSQNIDFKFKREDYLNALSTW